MKSAHSSILVLAVSSFNPPPAGHKLVGIWESEENHLQIEMFENDGEFFGRMIAHIKLTGRQSAMVRGYWKYRWMVRCMAFHRKR